MDGRMKLARTGARGERCLRRRSRGGAADERAGRLGGWPQRAAPAHEAVHLPGTWSASAPSPLPLADVKLTQLPCGAQTAGAQALWDRCGKGVLSGREISPHFLGAVAGERELKGRL